MANLSYNKVLLAGRLAEDPKLSSTPAGVTVCRFSVAYNPPAKNAEPEFYIVDAWEDRAQLVSRYFRRGSSIFVEGHFKTEAWTDRETGRRRTQVVIVADSVRFVDSRREAQERDAPEPDAADLENAKPDPRLYSTPGARGEIDGGSGDMDEEMPF